MKHGSTVNATKNPDESFRRNLAAIRADAEEEAAEAKAVEALKAEVERRERRNRPIRIKSFDC